MPPLSEKVTQRLRATVHERMVPANPFDFQMFDWNDEEQNAKNFTALLSEDFDVALCLLDYPREDLCDQSTWSGAERGFVRAAQQTGTKAAVLATFSDTISESVAARLMKDGVVMLAGIDAGLAGIQAAVDVGAAWKQPPSPPLLTSFGQQQDGWCQGVGRGRIQEPSRPEVAYRSLRAESFAAAMKRRQPRPKHWAIRSSLRH